MQSKCIVSFLLVLLFLIGGFISLSYIQLINKTKNQLRSATEKNMNIVNDSINETQTITGYNSSQYNNDAFFNNTMLSEDNLSIEQDRGLSLLNESYSTNKFDIKESPTNYTYKSIDNNITSTISSLPNFDDSMPFYNNTEKDDFKLTHEIIEETTTHHSNINKTEDNDFFIENNENTTDMVSSGDFQSSSIDFSKKMLNNTEITEINVIKQSNKETNLSDKTTNKNDKDNNSKPDYANEIYKHLEDSKWHEYIANKVSEILNTKKNLFLPDETLLQKDNFDSNNKNSNNNKIANSKKGDIPFDTDLDITSNRIDNSNVMEMAHATTAAFSSNETNSLYADKNTSDSAIKKITPSIYNKESRLSSDGDKVLKDNIYTEKTIDTPKKNISSNQKNEDNNDNSTYSRKNTKKTKDENNSNFMPSSTISTYNDDKINTKNDEHILVISDKDFVYYFGENVKIINKRNMSQTEAEDLSDYYSNLKKQGKHLDIIKATTIISETYYNSLKNKKNK